jgi:hypothetical protein
MDDISFTETIKKDEFKGGWTYLVWKDSSKCLGTRKAAKVEVLIDGVPFQVTALPNGEGAHLLPLRASILKAINKMAGDSVDVSLRRSQL